MNQSAILVVEDDVSLREALCDTLEFAGFSVEPAADAFAALELLNRREYGMVVSDVQMNTMDGHVLLKRIKTKWPDLPVLLMTAYGTIQNAVEAMRDGAIDYLVKPFEAEVLINLVTQIVSQQTEHSGDFLAVDRQSLEIAKLAERVAESDATVMIGGESGVGKEVLARYIHKKSRRAEQPFIAINCAAIPDNMLEATLFGYEKGAYTGAYKACAGKFEQAQGGTLLLDEISEMDLALQAKLLRVLQEREVERLGGNKLIQLDVRVLATSNRNMRREVAEGNFREDLFYRLNVFPIVVPPLRDRPADIIPLVERFLERSAKAYGRLVPTLSHGAKERLLSHTWPGNVRELDNVIQRALILQVGRELQAQDIRFEVGEQSVSFEPPAKAQQVSGDGNNLQSDVKTHEHHLIFETLQSSMGNRKLTAEKLGISERTLRYKLAKMREEGIAIPDALNGRINN